MKSKNAVYRLRVLIKFWNRKKTMLEIIAKDTTRVQANSILEPNKT